MGVEGSGFRVESFGFGLQDLGLRVLVLRFEVK